MASVRKNARGIWLARWVDASGVRKSRAALPNTRVAAKALPEELQLNARRLQEGLAPRLPRDGGGTVASLLEWWLESYSRRLASHASNEASVRRHLVRSALADLRLHACAPAAVEAFLDAKESEGLRPQTVNHLRAFLSRAFAAAIRVGRWPGMNPVTLVRKRKVPKASVGDHLHLLLREKVPLIVVQKVLRHRDPKLTEQVYGHLADDFLRDGVDRLHFEGMPAPSIASASGSGTPAGPNRTLMLNGPESRGENPRTSRPF
jgi:integrase